jgi:hypothetical protein
MADNKPLSRKPKRRRGARNLDHCENIESIRLDMLQQLITAVRFAAMFEAIDFDDSRRIEHLAMESAAAWLPARQPGERLQ